MRSKWQIWIASTALLLSAPACGILGEKDDIDKLLKFAGASTGCLNEMGPRFTRYMDGDVNTKEWEATWECAIDSLRLFRTFVRPTDPQGYSRRDMYAFVSKLLITSRKVPEDLILATFQLKASLLGGSADYVSNAELDHFLTLLRIGKKETTSLLPHLKARVRQPSPETLLAFANGLQSFGDAVAAQLRTTSNSPLTLQMIQTLTQGLSQIGGWQMPTETGKILLALKEFMVGGSAEAIEGGAWPALFRSLTQYGSVGAAAMSYKPEYSQIPNGTGEFYTAMARIVRTAMDTTLATHNDRLPYLSVARVIDALPEAWLTPQKRQSIQATLVPLSYKMLGSQIDDGFDRPSIDLLFNSMEFWNRGQTHLERIYKDYGLDPQGVSKGRLIAAAQSYLRTLPEPKDQEEVQRLINLTRKFLPMFAGEDDQITFGPWERYSLAHMSRLHWVRIVVERLIRSYSSLPTHDKGTLADLKSFIDDYAPLATAFSLIDPMIPKLAERRFQEANFFTFASNGDKFFDLDEATYYIAFYLSLSQLSNRIVSIIEPLCGTGEKDPFLIQWMKPDCFRDAFFARYQDFWDHFPNMVRYFSGLSHSDQTDLRIAIERGARRFGFSDQPVGKYDVDGFSALAHYIEAIFKRFDANQSQILGTSEVLNAFPVFKLALSEIGGIDINDNAMLEAAFTYTVAKGKPPTKDPVGIAKFLWWKTIRPTWNINATRSDIYSVIGVFSEPEPLPPAGLTSGK